ncbi:carbohydrate kinase family protein [Primorskyibacter flagellatus]|uniref:carbohydrate kinase family protein n=1 Tax=Primorskyibacter flagellatus TaxID=1387277 RepID=UPI003A8DEB65
MILCCGEALIDMLPRTTIEGEGAFAPHAGGAVFNTAIALGRLGTPTGYFGGLSHDLFGQLLENNLAASNVDSRLAPRSDRPTTLAFVTLTDGQAQYAFYDENTAGRMLRAEDLPALTDEVNALFFGGISLVGEPAADAYKALALREASRLPVMIDPNIRPGFITDEARYRARLDAMLAVSDIVKISDEDLHWLGTTPQGLLASGGPKLVLMTRGAQGVEAHIGSGSFEVPAQKALVVDTVGAGDTFNAGFLAGLSREGLLSKEAIASANSDMLRPAIELGARAAAVTVSRAGANPPWAEELA